MRTAALLAVLAVLLVATMLAGIYLWWSLSDVDIGLHGLIAMTLGSLLSLILGGGLMFLVFYSSRRGHDEEHHRGPRGYRGPAALSQADGGPEKSSIPVPKVEKLRA